MKNLEKLLLITCLAFSVVFVCFGQSEYILEWSANENSQISQWTQDCPNLYLKECQKVRLDAESNVIVAGTSNENGNYDFLIAKYSNEGIVFWKNLYGASTESIEYLTGVHVFENGNILVSGFSILNDNEARSLVIMLSAGGDVLWEQFLLEDYVWSFPQGISVNDDSDIYLTGYINQTFSSRQLYTVKMDSFGNILWEEIYSEDETGRYEGLEIRVVGNVVSVIGYFFRSFPQIRKVVTLNYSEDGELLSSNETPFEGNLSSAYIDENGSSYIGFFGDFEIVKYNQSGIEEWSFEVPTNLPNNVTADEVTDIISDGDGNVYITGRHYGENYGDTLNYTNGDLQVCKISPNGDLIYGYRYENLGTHAFDGGNKLFLSENHLVIGGMSQGVSVGTDYDYVSIVLDENGNAIDTVRFHQEGDEVVKSVIMDDEKNVYLTGIGNGSTLTQKYRFEKIVSIDENFGPESEVVFYPNPFESILVIEGDVFNSCELVLSNFSGEVVHKAIIDDLSNARLDLSWLSPGVYFVQLIDGDKNTINRKVIKL